jgi:hypothetical protein
VRCGEIGKGRVIEQVHASGEPSGPPPGPESVYPSTLSVGRGAHAKSRRACSLPGSAPEVT